MWTLETVNTLHEAYLYIFLYINKYVCHDTRTIETNSYAQLGNVSFLSVFVRNMLWCYFYFFW